MAGVTYKKSGNAGGGLDFEARLRAAAAENNSLFAGEQRRVKRARHTDRMQREIQNLRRTRALLLPRRLPGRVNLKSEAT